MAATTAVAAETANDGELVVNVGHLMEYVDEQKAEGNAAYKRGKHSEALAAWQRALDGIAQTEGKPMRKVDVEVVLRARVTLHSNKGQALLAMEFWRRAIEELSAALKIDTTNAKALWRRYKAHRALKDWAAAEADLERLLAPELQAAAAPLLADAGLQTAEQQQAAREELRQKREEVARIAEETFEDRAEWTAHKSIEGLREQFEEVTKRNGLHGNTELASELADMITRPGGVTVEHVAATYQIDDDDAEIVMKWAQVACKMRDEIGYESMSAI